MKYYLFLCLLTVTISCGTKSRSRQLGEQILSNTGTSPNMNAGRSPYKLDVPEGWTTEYRTIYGVNYYYLLAPKTAEDPNTSINVLTEYMQNLSLKEFTEKTMESVRLRVPGSNILSDGSITANGIEGAWYSYTIKSEGVDATLVQYIFPKDGVAYSLTAGTQTKDAERYRSLFDHVAKSLTFTE